MTAQREALVEMVRAAESTGLYALDEPVCLHCCGNCYEPDAETCDTCGEWIHKPFVD